MTKAFEGTLALSAKCGIEMNVAEPCLPSTILVLENSESRIRADTSLLYTTYSCNLRFDILKADCNSLSHQYNSS